jgi:predicted nucleic acid-binding protein
VDAGPLVAALNRRDRFHQWATERLREVDPPGLTCEPALAEACYLLRDITGSAEAVLDLIRDGSFRVPYRVEDEAAPLANLLRKYRDVPMSLADACLVRMAEVTPRAEVLTIDTDFRIYRTSTGRPLRMILPAS